MRKLASALLLVAFSASNASGATISSMPMRILERELYFDHNFTQIINGEPFVYRWRIMDYEPLHLTINYRSDLGTPEARPVVSITRSFTSANHRFTIGYGGFWSFF